MPNTHRFLQELALWGSLPFDPTTSVWQQLMHSATQKVLGKGALLLTCGTRWTNLYWIESGACRLYYGTEGGLESNKNFYLQGSMFWPITQRLQTEPVQFNIETLAPTRVWQLPWPRWQAQAGIDPRWLTHERQVLEHLLDDKMQREQAFLQLSATERYRLLARQHPQWLQGVPLRHLASYIGVTDVAMSRIRRKLRQQALNPG